LEIQLDTSPKKETESKKTKEAKEKEKKEGS
jgi:hypothetical protein